MATERWLTIVDLTVGPGSSRRSRSPRPGASSWSAPRTPWSSPPNGWPTSTTRHWSSRPDTSAPTAAGPTGAPPGTPTRPPATPLSRLLRRIGQVVCMTMVVAVPLTLISSRSVPPATNGTPPARRPPRMPAGPRRDGTAKHVFTASPQQLARAEAAYQRALARQQGDRRRRRRAAADSQRPRAVPAGQPAASHGPTQQPVQATAAAQGRAVARQQSAQTRAADQAAAAAAAGRRPRRRVSPPRRPRRPATGAAPVAAPRPLRPDPEGPTWHPTPFTVIGSRPHPGVPGLQLTPPRADHLLWPQARISE